MHYSMKNAAVLCKTFWPSGDSCKSTRAYAQHAVNHRTTQLQAFLMANYENIQFTYRILSSPTLSIAVTETVLKAQGSVRWKTNNGSRKW